MKNLRPALLAMLLAAAGLGVPGSFAQGTNGKSAETKKAPTVSGSSAKSTGKSMSSKAPEAKSSAAHKTAPTAGSSGKTSQASTKRTTTRGSGKKSMSSKRSRRQPGQKAPTSDRITEIQSALAKDGSFGGTPNGRWDDSTTDAMRKFQSAHGLNPTGKLDAPTLTKLGLGSQTAGVAAPTPPPGAVSRLSSSNSFPSSSPDSTHQ